MDPEELQGLSFHYFTWPSTGLPTCCSDVAVAHLTSAAEAVLPPFCRLEDCALATKPPQIMGQALDCFWIHLIFADCQPRTTPFVPADTDLGLLTK